MTYVTKAETRPMEFKHRQSDGRAWVALAILALSVAIVLTLVGFAHADGPSSMPAPQESWQQQVLELAGALVLGGLTILVAKANEWLKAHAKSAAAQYGAGVFERLSAQALTAVMAVQQIAKRDLSNPVQLKQDALAYLKSYLGPQGIADLEKIVGLDQVATVLSTHVEAAVLVVKSQAPAGAAGGSAAGAEPKA